jgi:hypothetical protein
MGYYHGLHMNERSRYSSFFALRHGKMACKGCFFFDPKGERKNECDDNTKAKKNKGNPEKENYKVKTGAKFVGSQAVHIPAARFSMYNCRSCHPDHQSQLDTISDAHGTDTHLRQREP